MSKLNLNDGKFRQEIDGIESGKTSQVAGVNAILNNIIGNTNYLQNKKLDKGTYDGTAQDLKNLIDMALRSYTNVVNGQTDLNTFVQQGIYRCQDMQDSQFNNIDTYPWGQLIVTVSGACIVQTYIPHANEYKTVRRVSYNNGTQWNDWYYDYNSANKPTKSDVGLNNVDNTSDANKNVNSAKKLTTSRNITVGDATKSFNGESDLNYTLQEIGVYSKEDVNNNFFKSRDILPSFDGTNGDFYKKVKAGSYRIDTGTFALMKLPNDVYTFGVLNVCYTDNGQRIHLEYVGDGDQGKCTLVNYNFSNNPNNKDIQTQAWKVLKTKDGDIQGRLFKATYPDESEINGGLVFRKNNTDDNYLRVCNDVHNIRDWLNVYSKNETFTSNVFTTLTGTPTFDTLVKNGIYPCNGATMPLGAYQWGNLLVFGSGNELIQIYVPHSDTSDIIFRCKWNGVWREWGRLTNRANVVRDIRLSGRTRKTVWDISIDLYASGRVLVGGAKDLQDGFLDSFDYANLQKLVGDTWITVTTS